MELPDKNSVLPKDEPIGKIEVQDMTLHVALSQKNMSMPCLKKEK